MLLTQPQPQVHMPFAFRIGRDICAVYSQSLPQFRRRFRKIVPDNPGRWKLHWSMPHLPAFGPIDTGLGENEDECSPAVCEVKGEFHLSFIGTAGPKRTSDKSLDREGHRLFVMSGPAIDRLGKARPYSEQETYCGFVRPDLAMRASGTDGTIHVDRDKTKTIRTSYAELYRISYCFDSPSQILITGSRGRGKLPETIIVDVRLRKVIGELRFQGQPTYKPSLLSNMAVIPTQAMPGEGWRLSNSSQFSIEPSSVSVEFT